jgi:hypothetical protein
MAALRRASFLLAQILHAQVAMRLEPVLVHLDRERPDQGYATCGFGEEAHHVGAD